MIASDWSPRAGRVPRFCLLAAVLTATGCGTSKRAPESAAVPPPVVVVEARQMDVPVETSGIGTTVALESVSIRPRVAAFLVASHFQEGQNIEPGQLLLSFDEANFIAKRDATQAKVQEAQASLSSAEQTKIVESAQAQLEVSQARLYLAQLDEARGRRLSERGAQTREEYDRQVASFKEAQADVDLKQAALLQAEVDKESNLALAQANLAEAQAQLAQAALDLESCELYATVDGRKDRPPIQGRAGQLLVKVGNYVNPLTTAELLSIQQLNPMGVDIQASSRYLPEITALLTQGIETRLIVQGDRVFPESARAYFLDNRIDPTTSTVLIKAKVANPDETLLPGDYVQTRTVIGSYPQMIVVPQQSVIQTQAGPVVYTVDEGNKVAVVRVDTADEYRGLRVLAPASGGGEPALPPGTRVIVEGIQLVSPGMSVEPRVQTLESIAPQAFQAEETRVRPRNSAGRLGLPIDQLMAQPAASGVTPADAPPPAAPETLSPPPAAATPMETTPSPAPGDAPSRNDGS